MQQITLQEAEYLTVPEVIKILRVDRVNFYRQLKKNRIPHIRVPGTSIIRIPKSILELYQSRSDMAKKDQRQACKELL